MHRTTRKEFSASTSKEARQSRRNEDMQSKGLPCDAGTSGRGPTSRSAYSEPRAESLERMSRVNQGAPNTPQGVPKCQTVVLTPRSVPTCLGRGPKSSSAHPEPPADPPAILGRTSAAFRLLKGASHVRATDLAKHKLATEEIVRNKNPCPRLYFQGYPPLPHA